MRIALRLAIMAMAAIDAGEIENSGIRIMSLHRMRRQKRQQQNDNDGDQPSRQYDGNITRHPICHISALTLESDRQIGMVVGSRRRRGGGASGPRGSLHSIGDAKAAAVAANVRDKINDLG